MQRKGWETCGLHATLMNLISTKIYFQFWFYEQFLVSKIIYERSLIIEIKFKYKDIDIYEDISNKSNINSCQIKKTTLSRGQASEYDLVVLLFYM
jgi:hypothetical protein